MSTKSNLSWWVPFSFQLATAKRDIPKIFSLAALTRIILVLFILIVIGSNTLSRLIPELEFNWVNVIFICIALLALILVMSCALVLIPPLIYVTTKGIVVMNRQATTHYPFTELVEFRIDDSELPPTLALRRFDQHTDLPPIN